MYCECGPEHFHRILSKFNGIHLGGDYKTPDDVYLFLFLPLHKALLPLSETLPSYLTLINTVIVNRRENE